MAQNKEFVDQHNKFLVEKVEKIKEIEKMNETFDKESTSIRSEIEALKDELSVFQQIA